MSPTPPERLTYLDDADVARLLPYDVLIAALRSGLLASAETPARQIFEVSGAGNLFLQMPIWITDRLIATKLLTFFPKNEQQGRPTVQGCVVLFDGKTGAPCALICAEELTLRRTAAASALAADSLAREDAERLLLIGTGRLARHMVIAHTAVRPYRVIEVWGRTPERAVSISSALRRDGLNAEPVIDLDRAIRAADVITCATTSCSPIIQGNAVKDGCHIDLVGGFTLDMREADDRTIARSRIFLDDIENVKKTAGDIAWPLKRGVIRDNDIVGDLKLIAGGGATRKSHSEITLYKAAGFAQLDLIASATVLERHHSHGIELSAE